MTNPTLSISTTQQIGRVYQLPGGTSAKEISGIAAKRGLNAGDLFPSITNILGVTNKNLEGYAVFMMGKALKEGKSQTEAAKEYITFRDFAATRGSAVHLLIEQYIDAGNGKRGTFLPAFKSLPAYQEVKALGGEGYMLGFLNFCRDYSPKFLNQEATVYGTTLTVPDPNPLRFMQREGQPLVRSPRPADGFNYAGTTDAVAEINGTTVILDWKCTSKLRSDSVVPQLAAVAKASHYFNTETGELDEWPTYQASAAVRLCSDGSYEIKGADIEAGWERFKKLRGLWDDYALGTDGMFLDPSALFNNSNN